MIRIIACLVGGGFLVLAAPHGHAAPAAKPPDRSPRASAGLESADPAVRRDAITRLAADRDPSAVAQLALALDGDDDEGVRQAAASGLGELADKRGSGALKRCLQQEQSQAVKRSCRVSLARLDPEAATREPEPIAAAPAVGTMAPGAPPGGTAASSQFDLRIDVTAQEAAARPNHVYVELWSALDKSTLALGFERVLGTHWSVALEPQFSAESQTSGAIKASSVSVALAR